MVKIRPTEILDVVAIAQDDICLAWKTDEMHRASAQVVSWNKFGMWAMTGVGKRFLS